MLTVVSFGRNGNVGNSNSDSHNLKTVTANVRGAPVEEKTQSLESIRVEKSR